ncbi:MAG: queuosine precursor transporter [Saprospiraceae bacterium]|nr:queuosine precursor transporter [Saprospiraceae bacterium]
MRQFFASRPNRLWTIMAGFFVANALVAEFMGVKLFSLEKTLGFTPVDWSLLGQSGLSFTLTAGVLLWPVVFVMTDLLNEYFGPRGVRFISYLTAGLIAYGFLMLFFAMGLEPADWWRTAHIKASLSPAEQEALRVQVGDYNTAYAVVFGQSLWIIVGSLFAFLISQVVDVAVFHRIKARTGEGKLWMRSTGSTMVSQFLDSFVVVFIALYIGQQLPFAQVLAISIMNYLYKGMVAIAMTPVIYGVHHAIDRYLGAEMAAEMKRVAQEGKR